METKKIRFFHILMCIIFLFMVVSPMNTLASPNETQQGTITIKGTISDKTGETLPGVSISIKGTTVGTVTDIDGQYTLNIPSRESVLTVSYIGYNTQEIKVGDRTTIDIVLDEDSKQLDEIVVVGYGVQKKVNLTGSVSSIDSEKLANRPAPNLSSALAGLAPGVRITQSSGNPGNEDVKISIRGYGSINASSPLILVDGIEADMSVVNPDDVESVNFLKDAASASIYGSRAAGGVILVTTKKGRKESPKVTFSALFAQEKAVTDMKFMSSSADWMSLHNTAVINSSPSTTSLRYEQPIIDEWRTANANPGGTYTHPVTGNTIPNSLAFPNTDWATEMFKSAFYHRYNLSVSGGSETSTYLLSGSFQDNPGALENTGMKRFNIRANVETKIKDFLTIGTQTYGTKEFKKPGNVEMTYLRQAVPTINPKVGGLYGVSEYTGLTQVNNVLATIASTGGENEYTRINTTWYANAKIWNGISAEAKFNYNEYQRQDETYTRNLPRYRFREGTENPVEGIGVLNQATSTRYSYFETAYTADLILRYLGTFGDHDISAFAAYEQYYGKKTGFRLTAKGLLDWSVTDINSAGTMDGFGSDKQKLDAAKKELGMLSYFGRVNYAYKSKYLFEGNIRSDASSRYAPGHRWGTFPSFSAGWRISEEPFFEPLKKQIDNLKLKVSYGQLGNQAVSEYYDWVSIYSSVNNVFNESVQNGVIQSQLPNYLLTWERSATTNFGFEANFLNQRLGVEFDYFTRKTTDMLVNPRLSLTAGTIISPRTNSAEMKSSGIDLNLTWNDKINDFRYSIGANISYNTNEITKYMGPVRYEADPSVLDIWGNPTMSYVNLSGASSNDVLDASTGKYVATNKYIAEGHMAYEYFLHKPYSGSGTYNKSDGSVDPTGGPKDGMIRTKADLDWVKAMIAAGYSFNGKTVGSAAGNLWYGEKIMADLNGDGRYGDSNDREFTGKSEIPKWTFGFNLSAEWKGIDMSMSWAGRLGSHHYVYSTGVNSSALSTNIDALPANGIGAYYSYDAVQAANDLNNYDPANDPNANITGKYSRLLTSDEVVRSSEFLYNTSFLKLKSLQIGYTFPKRWIERAKIANLRVFVTGENLLTIKSKDFPAVDPELGGGTNVYPIARMFSGGVSVTF